MLGEGEGGKKRWRGIDGIIKKRVKGEKGKKGNINEGNRGKTIQKMLVELVKEGGEEEKRSSGEGREGERREGEEEE